MYVTHQWFQRVVVGAFLVIMIGSSVALDVFAATGVDRYTALLVHGDGTDASTTFTDSSFRGASATTVGNAQVDTAQSKFGGASMLFDGSGDYVRFADSDLWYFANDDFTIDLWMRVTSATAVGTLFDHSQDPTNGPYFNLSKLSGALYLYWFHSGVNCNYQTNAVSWSANTWHHIAMVRYNGTVTFYVDGTSVGSTSGCPNYNDTSTFEIGGSGYNADFAGWIDEFRISKGIARWTANFTPPTGEYGPDGRVTTFLTSGTSWTVPSDWNSSRNTIEVIGGGGGGGNTNNNSGSGGGGGAFSRAVNVSLTQGGTVTYAVGSGGGTNTAGGDTYICNSTSNCASIAGSAVVAGAKGGSAGAGATGSAGGSGGATASGVGSTKYAGGNGAASTASFAGGGGAAAGPWGPGGAASVSDGGNGAGGLAGTGAANSNPGSTGGSGSEWGFGMGSGGGGSGCNRGNAVNAVGGAGGSYGGGGGGGCQQAGGTGGSGVIVITYFPSTAPGLVINASRFLSNLDIRGNLAKGSGTFMIDHPTKPATHLLYHSFVESPDVKNLYDGVIALDKNGEANVQLPDYFEALNKDFRYQFFPIDEAMPNLHIKKEVENNRFTIGGGVAGGEVSWQVTGIRHDPYILKNPIQVEVEKGPDTLKDKGECLYEFACIQY